MYELRDVLPLPLFLLLTFTFLFLLLFFFFKTSSTSNPTSPLSFPKPYPLIGHLLSFSCLTGQQIMVWLTNLIAFHSPTSTVVIHLPLGRLCIYTGNPSNVEHILKTKFSIYRKGFINKSVFRDVFGDSLFTQDGDTWKFQRSLLAQQFTHKALIKFVEKSVHFEVTHRLTPVLMDAATNNKVIDLQDVFQRFAFDNVCALAFGYDPAYLSLPLPEPIFTKAFDECITICHARFHSVFPFIWKTCRVLNIGSERRLKDLVRMIREFSSSMIESIQKKRALVGNPDDPESNLLEKLLECDRLDEKSVIDLVISFILAGRDTSSAALTWFFWLIHKHKHVEEEVMKEIEAYQEKIKNGNSNLNQNSSSPTSIVMEALKKMTYTHAALSETMRLHPPVPADCKEAATDDVLPDGTRVRKGAIVGYFAQAMGWSEKIWGPNWAQFLPERWLREDLDPVSGDMKRTFVPIDSYSFPVFLAGPRICLGKEMAYLQMKSVAAAILSRFKVVPVFPDGFEPVYFIETVANMHGGFPVRIEERVQVE